MANIYRRAEFQSGAHTLHQLPEDVGYEVAFAGRSNAGKSSAINVITDHHQLARTSKTPGRTQQINIFTLDAHRRLADLPGYGFAKVPVPVKLHWERTLQKYLEQRQSLRGLILMMDIRHPMTDLDQGLLFWCKASNLSAHILLTKADKLSYGKACASLQGVVRDLAKHEMPYTVQLFSSLKRTGIEEAHQRLDTWFEWDAVLPEPEVTPVPESC